MIRTPGNRTACLLLVLLAGCHVEAEITNKNQMIECQSVSGTFKYNTSDAKVAYGIGTETMVQMKDSDGWTRTFTASEISKWKCREVR